MVTFIIILFITTIMINLLDIIVNIRSSKRKAFYTMLEIKALRQVRDKLDRLKKE